jgi:hypothetical protein
VRLLGLGFALFRGVPFLLGEVVLDPVLAHQSCYGLVCSYPGWLLDSLAFVSGCSFGSVGIQASVFSVCPLFRSATLVFLAQLPVVSFLVQIFLPDLFPLQASPLFPVQQASLAALFLLIFFYFLTW